MVLAEAVSLFCSHTIQEYYTHPIKKIASISNIIWFSLPNPEVASEIQKERGFHHANIRQQQFRPFVASPGAAPQANRSRGLSTAVRQPMCRGPFFSHSRAAKMSHLPPCSISQNKRYYWQDRLLPVKI
jgi:hypothetical protein